MKKSEILSKEGVQQSTQEIEGQHYVSRSLEEAAEIGFEKTYEWFEDMVIRKNASVDFKTREDGHESATIKLKGPQGDHRGTYYTSDPGEINRLKTLQKGKTVIIED
mgnify:FL=1